MKLTPQQIDQFWTEGYLVIEDALDDGDIDPVVEEYAAWIDRRALELHAAGKLSQLYADESFERRLASITAECAEIYDDVDIDHMRGRATFEFLRNDHLMDVIEGILGPEITCNPIQHVRAKLPGSLRAPQSEGDGRDNNQRVNENVAPLHQDAQVHLEEADSTFILTVWLPMVDSTLDNGCLEVFPRVHKEETVYWGGGFGVSDEHMSGRQCVPLPMSKGSVILMHKFTPHRSGPNTTDGIRWSMDLRYQKTGTPTGRSFYPDFVTRSRAAPGSAYDDYDGWACQWKAALEKYPPRGRPGRKIHLNEPVKVSIQL